VNANPNHAPTAKMAAGTGGVMAVTNWLSNFGLLLLALIGFALIASKIIFRETSTASIKPLRYWKGLELQKDKDRIIDLTSILGDKNGFLETKEKHAVYN
jgi:hypothetical protein